MPKICAFPDCSNPVPYSVKGRLYCSDDCRYREGIRLKQERIDDDTRAKPLTRAKTHGPVHPEIREAANKLSIPPRLLDDIVARVTLTGKSPVIPAEVTTEYLIGGIERGLAMTIGGFDVYDVVTASGKDKASIISSLINALQLLKSEPTAIVKHLGDTKMDEYRDAFILEADRRSKIVDAEFEVIGEPN